jgi:hypothetical protein
MACPGTVLSHDNHGKFVTVLSPRAIQQKARHLAGRATVTHRFPQACPQTLWTTSRCVEGLTPTLALALSEIRCQRRDGFAGRAVVGTTRRGTLLRSCPRRLSRVGGDGWPAKARLGGGVFFVRVPRPAASSFTSQKRLPRRAVPGLAGREKTLQFLKMVLGIDGPSRPRRCPRRAGRRVAGVDANDRSARRCSFS